MADYFENQKRELRRRLEILRQQLEAGRIHFAPHLFDETKKSLLAVRYGADGEIELRRQGALHEPRSLVGDGVARLAAADAADFGSTAELVVANLD